MTIDSFGEKAPNSGQNKALSAFLGAVFSGQSSYRDPVSDQYLSNSPAPIDVNIGASVTADNPVKTIGVFTVKKF